MNYLAETTAPDSCSDNNCPIIGHLNTAETSHNTILNLIISVADFILFIGMALSIAWTIPGIIIGILIYTRSTHKNKLFRALACGLSGPLIFIGCIIIFTIIRIARVIIM